MKGSITQWQLSQLARSPMAMHRLTTNGTLPQPAQPDSPLIRLLKSLSPHQRACINGLTVDHRLGYSGQRTFATAGQALNWLAPPYAAAHYPSESWRDKRFVRPLTLEDLIACSADPEARHRATPDTCDNHNPTLDSPSC